MDNTHPYGKPINILRFSESKEVIVDIKELEKIFSHPEIHERKVVVLSIIGALRGGKSFFLDYCLRFLYAHFPSINNQNKSPSLESNFIKNETWMGSSNEPLNGFSWRIGTQRETAAIDFWSDIFLYTLNGEKIAIFVMDTPGLSDCDSNVSDNLRMFAFGALISSIQVFNINKQIQGDQLQFLESAIKCAYLNSKINEKFDEKPFKSLTFLIRDWENYEDYPFGSDGGTKYLQNIIKNKYKFIEQSFEKVDCCLLPHPGLKIIGRQSYDGNWLEMESNFKDELKSVIEHLLHPENLELKKVDSQKMTVKDMKVHIENCLKLFQSGDISETLYQSMTERNSTLMNIQYYSGINNGTTLNAMKAYDYESKLHQIERRFNELRQKESEFQAKLEAERRQKEQTERDLEQLKAELKVLQATIERERREAEERKKYDEQKWINYQAQQGREKQALQKRFIDEKERKRNEKAEIKQRKKEQKEKEKAIKAERKRQEARVKEGRIAPQERLEQYDQNREKAEESKTDLFVENLTDEAIDIVIDEVVSAAIDALEVSTAWTPLGAVISMLR
ncbi:atlastin-1-like [Chironomus tepperi]|uniref:atlastin-1-like n=1 Tax=Chironomus tepperi TaxID=113505 RepID=UPI00391F4670